MNNWWERGYPGGPMVAVRGFPRPLYPPDAPGYPASVDGSDVEAYKRTVSRAGRWEWQPFDQAYSNGFAHGLKGGNVVDTGVAGVQRQGSISPDSGWIGQQTFNLLRSIVIPDGLPHAGEHAMDARSVELLNAAWDRFGGKEPTSPPQTTSALERLRMATTQIGIKESPANSNQCKYTAWYNMVGPWCAMFVSWCDCIGDHPSGRFKKGSRYAYVPYIVNDARLGVNGLSITSSPKPGDLVCYDWSWDGEHDHVGIFESGNAGSFKAIEGNTSASNNSNGGEVMRRSRSSSEAALVFVRVAE